MLVNADAHLVLCDQGKRPLSAGWQDEANRPTVPEMPLGMLRAWVRRHIDNPEAPIYADCMRSVDQIREQVDQLKP